VKILVRIEKIKGAKVVAKNGMMIGKVEDVNLDENNWAVTTVDVRLEDNIAKLFGEKAGIGKKAIVPLPANLVGAINLATDTIYLTDKITDIESFKAQIETKRAIM